MIEVLSPGLFTSIQDRGRFGYRSIGVPTSGAMDSYSSQYANLILGNSKDMAAIEMTIIGAKFKFLKPTDIAIVGAQMNPKLNDVPISQNACIPVQKDDILSLGQSEIGARAYLAIKGGFESDLVMGSRSFSKGVTNEIRLEKGDQIGFYQDFKHLGIKTLDFKYNDTVLTDFILHASKGPEFEALNSTQQKQLWNSTFRISHQNNRMGYRIDGIIENDLKSIITSPVLPGTVQLTTSGQMIVLMRDSQTTGGYPRILQLDDFSINVLSQKQTGQEIKFRLKPLKCKN